MHSVFFNPSDAPFVLDDGSMIPAHDWGVADADSETVKVAGGTDRLIAVDKPAASSFRSSEHAYEGTELAIDPRVEAAFRRADELNAAAKKSPSTDDQEAPAR